MTDATLSSSATPNHATMSRNLIIKRRQTTMILTYGSILAEIQERD